MDLLPTEEQVQIIDASVSFLENELSTSRLQSLDKDTPALDKALLQKIAELGWLGMGLDEDLGGVGYGMSEEALLFAEMGKYLVSPAILASVLAARLAAKTQQKELAEAILTGEKMVALASATYTQKPSIGNTVSGEFLLIESTGADLILFADDDGVALIEKSALASEEPTQCFDEKIQMTLATVKDAASIAYLPSTEDNIYLRGVLLSAAMLLGIAEASRDRSVEYAKTREQFGKAIGSFQAVKHSCADMAVRCESVRSMLSHASITLQNGRSDGPFDTHAAKILATEAAQLNANAAVQVHGGMGFTQELDVHLFVKRAHIMDQLFGGKRKQLKSLLQQDAPQL